MSAITVRTRIVTASAAVAAAAALLVPASASAAPPRIVPGTGCTVAQVERAVQATSPEVAGYLRNPAIRAEFERIALLPEPQRRAEAERLIDRDPRARAAVDENRDVIEKRIALITATCARY